MSPPWVAKISRRLLGFCVVLAVGALLNFKYFYFPASASQVAMLVEPLLLFVALVNLPLSEQQAISFSQLLKRLILCVQ